MRRYKLAGHILVFLSVFNFVPVLAAPVAVQEMLEACADVADGGEEVIIVSGRRVEEEEDAWSGYHGLTQASPSSGSESNYLSTSSQHPRGSSTSDSSSGVYQETTNPIQPQSPASGEMRRPPYASGGTELPWNSPGEMRRPPYASGGTELPWNSPGEMRRPPYASGGTELPWNSPGETRRPTYIRAIQTALDALIPFLENPTTRKPKLITISLTSNTAIKKALDASPHEDQNESIIILKRLNNIVENFPDANFVFLWLPRKVPFVGFKRAKQLALEAIRTANTTNIIEPHTINKQKESTADTAITKWTERWHQSPHTSKAYQTALTAPPDGKTHHTFQMDYSSTEGAPAKFSRLTHSTLYRFITGHAFTGEYTQRFFPQHTPEQIACQCGEPLQTIEHVLFNCPLFTDARCKHLTINGHPRNLPQLLENPKRVQTLLRFLEETRACNKPRTEWEPG